jgi:hypothetical protein
MRRAIIVSSFLLTVLIFALGILMNYGLDFLRIGTIADVMSEHELDTAAYLAEQDFTDSFGGNRCQIMNARIAGLKEEIHKVGADLGSYSAYSFFKKTDYDYLKRKYFLLELRFLTLIEQLNTECNRPYIPIIFFYQIDQDVSERQGFILAEISKEYAQEVVVLSLDKDYKDEPLVQLLAAKYNVTEAPVVIVNHERKAGLVADEELRSTLRTLLKRADPAGKAYDFQYVLHAAGRDVDSFAESLRRLLAGNLSAFARADLMLMLGRIAQNDTLICDSMQWYDAAISATKNAEGQALVFETIASLDCGRNKRAFFREAAKRWAIANNTFRAQLDNSLASGQKLNLRFETAELQPALVAPSDASRIVIGETAVTMRPGDRVLAQADRVKRDWLGLQASDDLFGAQILTTFSERQWYNDSELREDIGWHEGGRMKEFVAAGVVPVIAYGTLAGRFRDTWYGVDDQGVFRFEIPLDKISYPTTRFLREDLAVVMDTHGMNMMVEQALRNNVSAVVACCDHPGKVKAAKYLSDRGVDVVCFPDKYAYLALGHNVSLVGSPPVKRENNSIVLGAQPVQIFLNETVVVMNATDAEYALWYYQTPASYFATLQGALPALRLDYVQIDGFNQMSRVVSRAERIRAGVIAARVFNQNDYETLKRWLLQGANRRAVLFHSTPYPYGYLLAQEFPVQVAFDDPNPAFVP